MSKKYIILAVVGVLVLAGTVGGTLLLARSFLIPPAAAAGTAAPAQAAPAKPVSHDPVYLSIEPAFVVNIQDGPRYRFFQVQVDVMARDPAVMTRLEKYLPRIKGELNMLFGSLQREQLNAAENRLALQKSTLETINKVLVEESGKAGIEAVYFTKFVVQ